MRTVNEAYVLPNPISWHRAAFNSIRQAVVKCKGVYLSKQQQQQQQQQQPSRVGQDGAACITCTRIY